MSELSDVYTRLGQLEVAMVEVKTILSGFIDSMATRIWVQDEIAPIHRDLGEMAHSIKSVSEKQAVLFAAHEKFLEEEGKRRIELQAAQIEALRQQTVGAWFWRVAKMAGALASMAVGAGILAALLKVLILYVLHGPK